MMPTPENILILFYNTMWGAPLSYPEAEIPDNCTLTTDVHSFRDAHAVVFHVPSVRIADLLRRRVQKRRGQIWVVWSMESAVHYARLGHPLFMNLFDLTMTYHLDADIVTPYFRHDFKELLRRPAPEKASGKTVNAFISSRYDKSGRMPYLKSLMGCMDVHSYGKVFRNKFVENDKGRETKMETISSYRFTLAFENAVERDYVTEKFYDPLLAGSVPVYLGAPNISDFSPGDHAFINVDEWGSPESLAEYLRLASRDDLEYQRFFALKTRPFNHRFLRLLEQQREHPFVRLYRAILKKRGAAPAEPV